MDLRNELGLSMVSIRESTHFAKDDLVVFPPINHENLYGFSRDRESSSVLSSPSSSFPSSSLSQSDSDGQFETDGKSPPSISHLRVEPSPSPSRWKSFYYPSLLEIDIAKCWWKLLLARVLSNFEKLATCSRYSLCSFSRALRSFYPLMGIAIWWWMRNRARARRRLREGEIAAHLRDSIKERDERIAQLLHQISQMNELFVKKKHSN